MIDAVSGSRGATGDSLGWYLVGEREGLKDIMHPMRPGITSAGIDQWRMISQNVDV